MLQPDGFSTLAEALDVAARGPTGFNIYSQRGEVVEVLPYADLRDQSRALAARAAPALSAPVYRLAIEASDRKDEVKITAAIAKLVEEDPSLVFEQNAATQDMVLAGQGEIHLKVAIEKLQSKYGLKLLTKPPRVPYRETIRKSASSRGRHKRQSGGHGQYGDVVLEIAPMPRGKGFAFHDRIKGGVAALRARLAQRIAQEIEIAARQGDRELPNKRVPELIAEMRHMAEDIQSVSGKKVPPN